ncbi:MAG: periplasmic heavy metal sensor [Bacteroidales bacterium]|nr:periplasmic heavy metal sensor [Bacteroidales bacterium]
MKRIFVIALALFLGMQCSDVLAQRPHREGPKPEPRPDITELVSDLSANQKRKLETITNESKDRVEKLRKEQRTVRDSINRYMEMDGDQSRTLYPLFDREAKLQAEISREMYVTKVRIDEILTPEQRKELQAANKRHHKGKRK